MISFKNICSDLARLALFVFCFFFPFLANYWCSDSPRAANWSGARKADEKVINNKWKEIIPGKVWFVQGESWGSSENASLPPGPRGRQKPRSDGSIHIAFKFWLKTTRNRCFGSWRFTAGFKFSPLPIFKEAGRENVISGGRLSLAVQLFHKAKRTQLARHDTYFSPKDRCKNRDRFCP